MCSGVGNPNVKQAESCDNTFLRINGNGLNSVNGNTVFFDLNKKKAPTIRATTETIPAMSKLSSVSMVGCYLLLVLIENVICMQRMIIVLIMRLQDR
mmetsp:Transcript_19649/g.21954  ORF Transcript_19649/g.21954 Transcript_19649/m.21954 type:complete len:97 (+) Transcript_19649:829-1119(+)